MHSDACSVCIMQIRFAMGNNNVGCQTTDSRSENENMCVCAHAKPKFVGNLQTSQHGLASGISIDCPIFIRFYFVSNQSCMSVQCAYSLQIWLFHVWINVNVTNHWVSSVSIRWNWFAYFTVRAHKHSSFKPLTHSFIHQQRVMQISKQISAKYFDGCVVLFAKVRWT